MREIRVLSVALDPGTGLFDDEHLRAYLADREVIRAEPQFFVHEGRPCWTVFLETRTLRGAGLEMRGDGRQEQPGSQDKRAGADFFLKPCLGGQGRGQSREVLARLWDPGGSAGTLVG